MSDLAETVPPPKRPFDWDRIIGLSALMASIVTVAFLAYQAYLMRIQVEASTWPYLQISESCCAQGLEIIAENKGVGPSLVRRAMVKVDGAPQKSWPSVLTALLKEPLPVYSTAVLVRRVLDSGEKVTLLKIPDPGYAARVHAEFLKGRVLATACYCSVLEKCWIAMPTSESLEVPACPEVAPERQFAQ